MYGLSGLKQTGPLIIKVPWDCLKTSKSTHGGTLKYTLYLEFFGPLWFSQTLPLKLICIILSFCMNQDVYLPPWTVLMCAC